MIAVTPVNLINTGYFTHYRNLFQKDFQKYLITFYKNRQSPGFLGNSIDLYV